jgi:hypothetical protein
LPEGEAAGWAWDNVLALGQVLVSEVCGQRALKGCSGACEKVGGSGETERASGWLWQRGKRTGVSRHGVAVLKSRGPLRVINGVFRRVRAPWSCRRSSAVSE